MRETRRVARVSPSTLYREVQGEAVLLQLDSGEYFGLDGVATRLWQLIVEKGALSAVEHSMLEEFDVDPQRLASDIDRMVDQLAARRLIDVDEDLETSSGR
jgi:hypothetical protein